MKANNLTICIPPNKGKTRECNKNCPYCISKITWCPEANIYKMRDNVPKVLKLLELEGIHNVLVTSKGEPLLNPFAFKLIVEKFKDYRLELQTNGIELFKPLAYNDFNKSWINFFRNFRLDTLALSFDQFGQVADFAKISSSYKDVGINIRICYNITTMLSGISFQTFMELSKKVKASQVLFRKISVPSTASRYSTEANWIKENGGVYLYKKLFDEVKNMDLPVIRYIKGVGGTVYDYGGIAVMFSDYCIEESVSETEGARSFIFHQDGHVYTSWDTPASILF